MPAPPPDLTAASGAMIMDGATSRRALTTAMLDLASRGLIAFRQDDGGFLGLGGHKVGIDVAPAAGDAEIEAQRRAQSAAADRSGRGRWRCSKLQALGAGEDGAFITSEDLPKFGSDVGAFDKALEDHVVEPRLVRREAEQGRRALGRPRDARHRRWRDRAHRRAQHPDLGADPDRQRRRSPAGS